VASGFRHIFDKYFFIFHIEWWITKAIDYTLLDKDANCRLILKNTRFSVAISRTYANKTTIIPFGGSGFLYIIAWFLSNQSYHNYLLFYCDVDETHALSVII